MPSDVHKFVRCDVVKKYSISIYRLILLLCMRKCGVNETELIRFMFFDKYKYLSKFYWVLKIINVEMEHCFDVMFRPCNNIVAKIMQYDRLKVYVTGTYFILLPLFG
jgi:hypothetical protein